jgi:hypothetical protein
VAAAAPVVVQKAPDSAITRRVFHAQGWEDFTYWATADKKILRRNYGD